MVTEKKVIVIAGPTAVGKTALSIQLAQVLNTEIISSDSRQCYQGMHIGTAQVSYDERKLVPHHFIDCFKVDEEHSAASFEQFAIEKLMQIFKTKDVAVVCGGTGLYIKALCEGLDPMPNIDPSINKEVVKNFELYGIGWLQNEIKNHDPLFANLGELGNPTRIIRALVFKLSIGESILTYRKNINKIRPFTIFKYYLNMDRQHLYERINQRVDKMMLDGLLDEAKMLYDKRSLKNLQTVGYKELFAYLDSLISLDRAVELIKQHTRNYAKRQITWFSNEGSYKLINVPSDNVLQIILKDLNT